MPPFITGVRLKNYKSIEHCSVKLGSLTFLVGPNGSGKSNFLDALRFVSDGLNTSLEHAIRDRGGVNEVRRRSAGRPTNFVISLGFTLDEAMHGWYAFRVSARKGGGFSVRHEQCCLKYRIGSLVMHHFFDVTNGVVTGLEDPPPALPDRLYLVNAAGRERFHRVYEALSSMAFYNLNLDVIRMPQPPGSGERLGRDGMNIASVLALLERDHVDTKQRVEEYLTHIAPGIATVRAKEIGPYETLEFLQNVEGSSGPWRFPAASMSDGTLLALGVLIALFQRESGPCRDPRLVGIEEPEFALHPAAAGLLLDALREASTSKQVVVTSHSPDLLDDKRISEDEILAVTSSGGSTQIGQLNLFGRTALREHLSTPGDLLRQSALAPEEPVSSLSERDLFPLPPFMKK